MKTEKVVGLRLDDRDNVATIFNDVEKGQTIEILKKDGSVSHIEALTSIPYGHKIAVEDIQEGEAITKYGEEIGISTAPITEGEWVHVHNLQSARGRGDWQERKGEEQ